MSSFGLEWVTLKYHESCPLNNVISIHLFLPAELVHFHPCDLCVSMWTDDGGALHFQCLGSLRDDAVDVNWNISNDHDTPFVGLRLNSSSLDLHDPTCQGLQDYCRARPGPVPRCPYEDSVGKTRCWSVWWCRFSWRKQICESSPGGFLGQTLLSSIVTWSSWLSLSRTT